MTQHELAMAAAKLCKEEFYFCFPVRLDKIPCWRCWRPGGCLRCNATRRPDCEHCSHGFKTASDRPKRVYEMFMASPDAALIGVVTGAASMILAIDVDHPSDGARWTGLRWFRDNIWRFPDTLMHETPRGGLHLIYQLPGPPTELIGCPQKNRIAPAIDVKGEGGSIIWPAPAPYQHTTPGYRVVNEAPIAPLPKWIINVLTRKEHEQPGVTSRLPISDNLDGVINYIKKSLDGSRNNVCFWGGCRAGTLVKAGKLSENEAVSIVAQAGIEAGLKPAAALATARSGVRTTARG